MPPIVILKTGSTFPELALERGDCDAWIAESLGFPSGEVRTVDVTRDEPLPSPRDARAYLVTGSPSMVTDREPWSTRTARFLLDVVSADVPLLAICYGHQLLADALGGVVANNPRGRQIGTIEVALTAEGRADPLFAGAPSPLRVQATHLQSVLELPRGVRHLATSPRDPHAAFAVEGARAWGVQFHPEYDAHIIRTYIRARAEAIRSEGDDPDALHDAAHDTPDGPRLFARFRELVGG